MFHALFHYSIEDDILNLVDEVDLDEFLKEASEAIDDAEKLSEFIKEKSTVAIERFLVSDSGSDGREMTQFIGRAHDLLCIAGLSSKIVHSCGKARPC